MEDPDADSGGHTPVVFQAVEPPQQSATGDGKKSGKNSVAERLRNRRSTPRPTLKGPGKKRFDSSPSPVSKQGDKRIQQNLSFGDVVWEGKNKKNLLKDLNEVAEIISTPVSESEKTSSGASGEGAGTTSLIASPLAPASEAVGIEMEVASPLGKKDKGVGTAEMVASPFDLSGEGAGTIEAVASPQCLAMVITEICEGNIVTLEEEGNRGVEIAYHPMIEEMNGESRVSSGVSSSPEKAIGNGNGNQPVNVESMGAKLEAQDVSGQGVGDLGKLEKEAESRNEIVSHVRPIPTSGKETKRQGEIGSHSFSQIVAVNNQSNTNGNESINCSTNINPFCNDMVMDVCAAQPLRRQPIFSNQSPVSPEKEENCWNVKFKGVGTENKEVGAVVSCPTSIPENKATFGNFESDFPPLQYGRIKDMVKNFEGGSSSVSFIERKGEQEGNKSGVHQFIQSSEERKEISMAEVVKNAEAKPVGREPVNFNKDKIKQIGIVTMSEGRPALVFSSEDTKYLADQMGQTIVGKFSHSIPSSTQIQKALESIKFKGSFSWRYINAKHIAIRVEEPDDYATLLIGTNGMPVWYVEYHPMRVFKWTTDFDPFFETPIAAVWCNIIGLPIHLFDKSALYAIGKLLGTPIQLDHATANQSRLSFARLCIEIDISKSTNEEIVLDICGKESTYKVVWDKIPPYCRDCQHVGHLRAKCLAFGKQDTGDKSTNQLERRGGNSTYYQTRYQGGNGSNGGNRRDQPGGTKEKYRNNQSAEANRFNSQNQSFKWQEKHQQRKENGKSKEMDEEGFMKQGNRRGVKQRQEGLIRTSSTGNIHNGKGVEEKSEPCQTTTAERKSGTLAKHRKEIRGRKQEEELLRFAKPSYYHQLENGNFTTGDTDEEEDMDEDPGTSIIIFPDQNCNEGPMETEQLLLMGLSAENDRGVATPSYSIRF